MARTEEQKSYIKMWHEIEENMYNMSSDKYRADLPELRLFSAVIVQAAKDKDIDYFDSDEFERHAVLLRLSAAFLKRTIKKAWNVEKSGKIWSLTPPQEEED